MISKEDIVEVRIGLGGKESIEGLLKDLSGQS